jgi:DNA-directed RNA polymerase subunit RPC12/RpoP
LRFLRPVGKLSGAFLWRSGKVSEAAQKFSCLGCGRELTWKQEFVGRRIKCKYCAHSMAIPAYPIGAEPAAESGDDEMYALSDLAQDARQAAESLPPTIVESIAQPAVVAAGGAAPAARSAIPLAYRRGPTAGETKRAAESSQIDKNRDIKVPLALMGVGAVLYISYYAIHYGLGPLQLVAIGIGLIVMTILETAVLFGFALAVAGPLSVNFGGIGTALLKMAAIALFCDGIATWVDGLFSTWAGGFGGGLLGFGVMGLPVALVVYWCCVTYLFSMDPGDAWLVVVILAVFYRIVRTVLLILLLRFILSFGGVAATKIALPAFGGSAVPTSPIIDTVNQAKAQNLLHEARQYANDFGLSAYKPSIEGWYKAGAANVWFETDRDINGKGNAFRMVVEMPSDPTARANCYAVLKQYYNDMGEGFLGQGLQDTGDPYLLVPLP